MLSGIFQTNSEITSYLNQIKLMDYLKTILDSKKHQLQKILPLEGKLRAAAILRNDYAGFKTALDLGEDQLSIVPEIAKSYPHNPDFALDMDVLKQFTMFEQGRPQALSVQTEPILHHGTWEMLAGISKKSTVPLLARDYFTHPVEICQAVIYGADAINLVVAALTPNQLKELHALAHGLGLDVMIEVSNFTELEIAMDVSEDLICINNTNPHTLKTYLNATHLLIEELPASTIVLASGGIETPADAQLMLEAGAHGIILQDNLIQAHAPQYLMQELSDVRLNTPYDGEE